MSGRAADRMGSGNIARRHVATLKRRRDYLKASLEQRSQDPEYRGNTDPIRREILAIDWALDRLSVTVDVAAAQALPQGNAEHWKEE